MTHGSTFTGIGGFDLAAQWMGWENIFHCELHKAKQIELRKLFPNSTPYGNICDTDFTAHRGKIDVLSGGFPCQDASIAKRDGEGQQGLQGARTGLLFEMLRVIDEIRPRYVVAENVANFLKVNGGADFRTVLSRLAAMGYNAEWRVCSAAEVGAPHKRKRLYLVSYTNSIRLQEGETFFSVLPEKASPIPWQFAGASIPLSRGGTWLSEPPVLCMADGLSGRLVRQHLHSYGNAVVPQIAYNIFKAIAAYENTNPVS
jgi:DNA (cytosine-5)-methyltransferase 1